LPSTKLTSTKLVKRLITKNRFFLFVACLTILNCQTYGIFASCAWLLA
jgi:hypothetical protein